MRIHRLTANQGYKWAGVRGRASIKAATAAEAAEDAGERRTAALGGTGTQCGIAQWRGGEEDAGDEQLRVREGRGADVIRPLNTIA